MVYMFFHVFTNGFFAFLSELYYVISFQCYSTKHFWAAWLNLKPAPSGSLPHSEQPNTILLWTSGTTTPKLKRAPIAVLTSLFSRRLISRTVSCRDYARDKCLPPTAQTRPWRREEEEGRAIGGQRAHTNIGCWWQSQTSETRLITSGRRRHTTQRRPNLPVYASI